MIKYHEITEQTPQYRCCDDILEMTLGIFMRYSYFKLPLHLMYLVLYPEFVINSDY